MGSIPGSLPSAVGGVKGTRAGRFGMAGGSVPQWPRACPERAPGLDSRDRDSRIPHDPMPLSRTTLTPPLSKAPATSHGHALRLLGVGTAYSLPLVLYGQQVLLYI